MKRIAIVEDDTLLADMYKVKFELAGYKVEVYHAAEDALDEIASHPPDLVILDVLLPGNNGLWLLKELHSRKIKTKVVMLTNLAEADFAMPPKLRETLGVVGYHVKTQVTPAEVLAGVQEVLA
jgi:DNA-binding response OmpR family regulator